MPFTLSQLKSQDLRDINCFYAQDDIEKSSGSNTHVFGGRNTFLENEEDRPAHCKRKKKNKEHEAYRYTDTEDAGNVSSDKMIILNNARDVCTKNAEKVGSYEEFSCVEHNNDLFKSSTQVDMSRDTQNTGQKMKKKHKKNRHREIELENLHENLHVKEKKHKTKPKIVEDEYAFQDSESSCATEGSNKSKKRRKFLDNDTLSNYSLENDLISESSIDSNSKSAKTKNKRKEGIRAKNIHCDYDDLALESLIFTDVNKPKKKNSWTVSANSQKENNLHSEADAENTSVLINDTDKLNDFVMPKKIKLEEDSTFSTDTDLLDSYLYFSYKDNQPKKKKKKEKIESMPMPIMIKIENDLDEEEQSLANAMQNSPVHSDQSSRSPSKKHKRKHKDHLVEEDKNDSHDEVKSLNKKHKKKHANHVLEDQLNRLEDTHSEQIISSERHETTNEAMLQTVEDKEERHINNVKNSTLIYDMKKKCSSKHQTEDVTSAPQKNDDSYLCFKNSLLHNEVLSQMGDINEATNMKSDKKPKKHKKKSKEKPEIYGECPEVTSVSCEKSFDKEEQEKNVTENFNEKAVGKPETSEHDKKEFKQKHKKPKVTAEDKEIQKNTILEPLINIKIHKVSDASSDDYFNMKKKIGRTEICHFGNEDLTGTCTDQFEIKAIIKKRCDLYELHANSDVRKDPLNRKAWNDVLNSFKKKLSTTLNQCGKQICSESIGAHEIEPHRKTKSLGNDALLSLQVNLTFTETSNDVQDKTDCQKNEKLSERDESKLNHDDEIVLKYKTTTNCAEVNSNENEKLFERKESTVVSLSNTITHNDDQECTKVNHCKSKELPELEESKLMSPTNVSSQLDFTTTDDRTDKSAEVKMNPEPKTILEHHTSNETPQKLIEDVTRCGDIDFDLPSRQQSLPFNENVRIIQNMRLTVSQVFAHTSNNNNNTEIIALKETNPQLSFENKSQLESTSKEDTVLSAEESSCVDAKNQMPQADKNSNVEVDEILKNSEIQATNSEQQVDNILSLEIQATNLEYHSDASNSSRDKSEQKLTIFDEDTVVLSPNKNKSEENVDALTETSKENNQKLESTTMITKETGECSSLTFESFFNNHKAKAIAHKKNTEEVGCQKKLIFNNETELSNTKNITENSSVNSNNTPIVSIANKQNESRMTQGNLTCTEDLRNRFEDLDSSFSLSDSDCESSEKHVEKSSSKLISPNVTDLYNRLMCDTSVDGDETAVDEIINEALENAEESSIHLVEENQFLKDLVICIPWEIPLAHTIETRMSSQPTQAQKNKFKELNVPLKLGPYTKKEDKMILSNFEEFCKVHDISHDPKPFLNFKYASKTTLLNQPQRIQFVQYLGKGLECRMLQSIYRRFVCLCTEKRKGRFTEEENAIIEKYINNNQGKQDDKKFSTLSKILNRDRLAVQKRYKYLLSKQKLKKEKYKIKSHIPEFLKHLMEILAIKEVNQLKDAKITKDVWVKLANKMEQSEIKVKRVWETIIYPRLFAECPIDVNKIMKRLIYKLIKLNKTDYRDVNWCEIATEFENVTPAYLYQMFRRLVSAYVPERKRNDLSSTLNHLSYAYRECNSILKMQAKMEYQNGEVSFITDL